MAALDAQAKAETEQKRLQATVDNLSADLDGAKKNGAKLTDELDAANSTIAMYKEKYGGIGQPPAPAGTNNPQPGWRAADTGQTKPKPSEADNSARGGWRRAKPEEKE